MTALHADASAAAHGDLDAALLSAHAVGDGIRLADLYRAAGMAASAAQARAFYLTHAMVHALEAGLPDAEEIRAILRRMGAEP